MHGKQTFSDGSFSAGGFQCIVLLRKINVSKKKKGGDSRYVQNLISHKIDKLARD